jgi:hypothetical protein
MQRYSLTVICACSVLALGLAMMLHEGAHIMVGRMVGGTPTLLTTTEVVGDFRSLSTAGRVAFGAAGSLANVLLCACGWLVLEGKPARADARLAAWLFFAVNGMIVVTKMLGESVTGLGDWMTILGTLPATTLLRVLVAVLGTAGLVLMVRRSGAALATIIPAGEPSQRRAEALRIVLAAALASTVLVLGGTVANPVGTMRGALLSLGAGPGQFVPIVSGTRFVGRTASKVDGPFVSRSWPWLLAAGGVIVIMWFVIGPGVTLSKSRS